MPDRNTRMAPVAEAAEPEETVLDPVPAPRGPVLIDGALAPVFRVPDLEPGAA